MDVDDESQVRREKLGERIAVLQQLVSPYGKVKDDDDDDDQEIGLKVLRNEDLLMGFF